ncbi:MAG TPA: hypothetical protein ENN23_06475 [Deltaproteobacteria bacterium]|nr:hypothetical protein [Deltaproteobacteria bacterium]
MLKKFRFTYLVVAFFMALALLAGCGSSGGDGAFIPLQRTATVEAGDAELTCADEGDMVACRGIKYAEAERFAPPELVELEGEINARRFGNICPQGATAFTPPGEMSEDCLSLNVFFPKGTEPDDKLPVMVWIHGGAFVTGGSSDPGYDMPALVGKGVIVVTVNYRLGLFGFLDHESLEGDPGNYGLKDQVKALEWVQAYIADFGGDPTNVTIFGESAGGHSVFSLLVSPSAAKLFNKAIIQSGSYYPDQISSEDARTAWYNEVVNDLCVGKSDILACLRDDYTAAQIYEAGKEITPVPTTETEFLPASTESVLSAGGTINASAVMLGGNLNEGNLFVALDIFEAAAAIEEGDFSKLNMLYITEDDYDGAVEDLFAWDPYALDLWEDIADYYLFKQFMESGEEEDIFRKAYGSLQTDWLFNCNKLRHFDYLADQVPTYAYWFADTVAPNPGLDLGVAGILAAVYGEGFVTTFKMLATHMLEIQYVFGSVGARGGNADQVTLSDTMMDYWTNFAKFDNPNNGGTTWKQFSDDGFILKLVPPTPEGATGTEFSTTHSCDKWETIWAGENPFVVEVKE